VLSLRGGSKSQVTAQPLSDATSGNILMWNGEIFGSDLFCVGNDENDAQRLLEELSKEDTTTTTTTDPTIETNRILNIVKSVRGPYAFLFYHHTSKCIYFGRDRLGRRSLLISLSTNTNQNDQAGNRPLIALSSVKCEPKVKDPNEWLFKEMNEFDELKANGIYKLDLNELENQTLPVICLYEWKKVRQGLVFAILIKKYLGMFL